MMSVLFAQLELFAALDWVQVLIAIVVFVIWGINHLVSSVGKAKPQQRPRPAPPRNVVPKNQPAPAQNLSGEIEDFLKRAAQKRQDKSRRKKPEPVVEKKVVVPPKPVTMLSDTSDQDFEVRTGQSVADHVREHLDNRQFSQRAEHLGDQGINKGDLEREAHRKQVFDHQLGRLADTSNQQSEKILTAQAATRQATTDAAAAAAIPIASMLANPESLKQAVILNEILSRPEHRW